MKKLLIQRDLIDPFDKTPLGNLDMFTLQVHLNTLTIWRKLAPRTECFRSGLTLRDIFAEAVDQDFLVKDPARKVTVPSQLRDTDRTTLTWWQLRGALSKLSLRDRILLELDMTNALRPGELFALRWQVSAIPNAPCGSRKPYTKAKSDPRVRLERAWDPCTFRKNWPTICGSGSSDAPTPSPNAFIFPNKKGGFMDSNNCRKRALHGLAQELELPKLTFQVIRRTIATLAQKKRTVKDIQGVLRHSRIATTTDVYLQEIPEGAQKTVDAISAELRLLLNLEEVTHGTSVLLPNCYQKTASGFGAEPWGIGPFTNTLRRKSLSCMWGLRRHISDHRRLEADAPPHFRPFDPMTFVSQPSLSREPIDTCQSSRFVLQKCVR